VARADLEDDVDELPRPENVVGVREGRLEPQRPGGAIDHVVEEAHLSGDRIVAAAGGLHFHVQRSRRAPGADLPQALLRHREGDVDRPHLVDHHQRRVAVGLHDVAGVDVELSGPPRDGRLDGAVFERHLCILDRRLVGLHRRLEAGGVGADPVVLLLRDVLLLDQVGVALQVARRGLRLHPVARQRGLRRPEGRRERAPVETEQKVARPHVVPFLEMDLLEHAADLGAHLDGGVGLHRANGVQRDRHVLPDRGGRGHRHRGLHDGALLAARAGERDQ
jgi:hypothetical protein